MALRGLPHSLKEPFLTALIELVDGCTLQSDGLPRHPRLVAASDALAAQAIVI
jgi:hypothetical protein